MKLRKPNRGVVHRSTRVLPPRAETRVQRVARLLRTQHKTLVVLGAAIVFLTFVVKEGLREKMKEELDEITAARSAYTQRTYHLEVMNRLEEMGGPSRADSEAVSGWYFDDEKVTEFQEWQIVESTRDYYEDLRSSSALVANLPKDEELSKAWDNAIEEHEKLISVMNKAEHAFDIVMPASKKRRASPAQIAIGDQALKQIDISNYAIQHYSSLALESAEKTQEERKHRYDVFTVWSYVLFSVGWIVALVGKLFDPTKDEGEDEIEA